MLLHVALTAINHVLTNESWARQRLKQYAGQSLRLGLGRFTLPLAIAPDGFFIRDLSDHSLATVTIELPTDAPARLVLDHSSLLSSIQIRGSAELAECLSFVFKNLRWDAEHDLAERIGDIAAHRIVEGGKRLAGWQAKQAKNLAGNLIEFFTTEQPALAQRQEVARFYRSVNETEDALVRLEQRISRIER